MKRNRLLCCFLPLVLLMGCCSHNKLDSNPAIIHYSYSGVEFHIELSEEETKEVKKILCWKIPVSDNPSCGFSPEISIELGDYTYAIARDSCGILMIVEIDKYIFISSNARERLEKIFTNHGAIFPCV